MWTMIELVNDYRFSIVLQKANTSVGGRTAPELKEWLRRFLVYTD